jgi:hypothetical protein
MQIHRVLLGRPDAPSSVGSEPTFFSLLSNSATLRKRLQTIAHTYDSGGGVWRMVVLASRLNHHYEATRRVPSLS